MNYIEFLAVAIIISILCSFIGVGIINELPRMGEKDQITISWEVCFVGLGIFQILVPWLTSLFWVKKMKWRLIFLICFIIAFLIVNGAFGGLIAFDKAWRRGL